MKMLGAADRNRTRNPQLRRLVLYPVELPPHGEKRVILMCNWEDRQ